MARKYRPIPPQDLYDRQDDEINTNDETEEYETNEQTDINASESETESISEYKNESVTIVEEINIKENLSNSAAQDNIVKRDRVNIFIDFPKSSLQVTCILSTGYQDKVVVASNSLRLLQNRLYLIPINEKLINSDDYNIKVMSDMAQNIDVRYVKDGFACVQSIKHNVKINNGDRIAVLN